MTPIDKNRVRLIRAALDAGVKSIGFCDGIALVTAFCTGLPGAPPRPAMDQHKQYDAEDFAAVLDAAEKALGIKADDVIVPKPEPQPTPTDAPQAAPAKRTKKKSSGGRSAAAKPTDDGQ